MQQGVAVGVVRALEERPGHRIGRRGALLQQHVNKHGGHYGEVDRLLGDRDPGIDAPRGENVEDKAGGEKRRGDATFVAAVVEL
jgi:hypothetical protein